MRLQGMRPVGDVGRAVNVGGRKFALQRNGGVRVFLWTICCSRFMINLLYATLKTNFAQSFEVN